MDAWLLIGEDTALGLRPGRTFVARVVRAAEGRAVLSLAGSLVEVAAAAPLAAGARVRLEVTAVEEGRVALRLRPLDAPAGPDVPPPEGRVDRRV